MSSHIVARTAACLVVVLGLVGCSAATSPPEPEVATQSPVKIVGSFAVTDGDQIVAIYDQDGDDKTLRYGDSRAIEDTSAHRFFMQYSPTEYPSQPPTQKNPGPPPPPHNPSPNPCATRPDGSCYDVPYPGTYRTPTTGAAVVNAQTFSVPSSLHWEYSFDEMELAARVAFFNTYVANVQELEAIKHLDIVNRTHVDTVIQAAAQTDPSIIVSYQAAGWSSLTSDPSVAADWVNGMPADQAYTRKTGFIPTQPEKVTYRFDCQTYEIAPANSQALAQVFQQLFSGQVTYIGTSALQPPYVAVTTAEPCGVILPEETNAQSNS